MRFPQAYGNDLNEAKKWCQRYRTSLNIRDLNQAWDLYYHVFRRISRQLPQLTQLELQVRGFIQNWAQMWQPFTYPSHRVIDVTSFSVFYTEATVSIGRKQLTQNGNIHSVKLDVYAV